MMEIWKRLSIMMILEILRVDKVFAHQDIWINSNLSRGILGCKLGCYRHGSCSEISYDNDQLTCLFALSSWATDAKIDVMGKLLSEFPCANNSCGRHKKCLTTRKGRQQCIDIFIKSKVMTGLSKGISERTLVWTTEYKECAYDFITLQLECIKYQGWQAVAMDPETGDVFYSKEETKTIFRKKVLSKKKDYEGKGTSRHFHILKEQKVAYVDTKSSVHVTTSTFQQQLCKFKIGRAGEFWTGVDHENELIMFATQAFSHFNFKTVDLKSCTRGATFKLRGDRFIDFVMHAGKIFFCSSSSLRVVTLKNKRSKKIKNKCEKIFLFHGNIYTVLPNFRKIKKFDSKGKFLKIFKMPPRSGTDVAFLQFTSLSLKDLKKMENL